MITERPEEAATAKDYYEATRDSLTRFVNRHVLQDAIDRAIAKARRGKRSVLLVVDIDNFKMVNESFGQETGDRVLKDVTAVIKNWLRDEDLLARLGSDEFAALLDGEGLEGAEIAAERMRTAIEDYREAEWNFSLSLSIGLVAVGGVVTSDQVLREGDTAMYEAKQAGGNRIFVYGRDTTA